MGFIRIFAVLAFWAGTALADSVTVFAAASTKTALEKVATEFEATTGHQVVLSFAGTAILARQIQYGAPVNLFISANADWMDFVQQQDLIVAKSRIDLLSNQLVLVGQGETSSQIITDQFSFAKRLGQGRLAMALVQSVPAGIYGREALETLGVWETIAGKIAQTDNVRAALALVALGEAPLGIVYASDAKAEPRVNILGLFPADSHSKIRYPAALVAAGATPAAHAFLDFLQGAKAHAIFEENGFAIPEP